MILSTLVLAASDPVGHVANHRFAVTELFGFKDFWLWSGHVGNLVLSGLVCILVGLWAASKIGTGPESQGPARYVTRNPFAHMLEVICVYLRENTVRPLLGARTDTFMPFLWTLFFFILVNNLLGLVPFTDMQHLASSDMKAKGLAFVKVRDRADHFRHTGNRQCRRSLPLDAECSSSSECSTPTCRQGKCLLSSTGPGPAQLPKR